MGSTSSAQNSVVLLACGDVGPVHEPVDQYAQLAKPVLEQADLRFAQCERLYSTRGTMQIHSGGHHSRLEPHMAAVFEDCGFDVVSVAGNHAMDWGADALVDTIEGFRRRGIVAIGGGRNSQEARRPAILERKGVTVAFLAYCSVLRDGYAAGPNSPGIAPLRAHTYYRPREYQAGMPPEVVTVPYQDDLDAMLQDVARVRTDADVVVLSVHWGLHFIPRAIADYQRLIATAAFESGVDLIVGHHAHIPKAIASYDGKVCFFSLSNFIMSVPEIMPGQARQLAERYGIEPSPDYPRLPYGPDGVRTLIARAELSSAGVVRVSFLPALIDKELRPEILEQGDPRFAELVRFFDSISSEFDHDFRVEGNEVVVT